MVPFPYFLLSKLEPDGCILAEVLRSPPDKADEGEIEMAEAVLRSIRCRWTGLAAGAVMVLMAAVPGWAQAPGGTPTPVPADSDFDVVQVDLEGQLFNRVLPFDVPFILTGMVPSGVTRLQIRCWELPPDQAKSSGLPPTATGRGLANGAGKRLLARGGAPGVAQYH